MMTTFVGLSILSYLRALLSTRIENDWVKPPEGNLIGRLCPFKNF